MTVSILILFVLVYIAVKISDLKPKTSGLEEIKDKLDDIKSSIDDVKSAVSDISFDVGYMPDHVKSIENAIRAKVSGWLDEYEIMAEGSAHPPIHASPKTTS